MTDKVNGSSYESMGSVKRPTEGGQRWCFERGVCNVPDEMVQRYSSFLGWCGLVILYSLIGLVLLFPEQLAYNAVSIAGEKG